jgi:hypothetical protein
MKTCWLCPNPLEGDQRSGEHVIPNAIGGRKEVFSFICRSCNGNHGREWEAELAAQFLWFSSAAGVSRGRGGKHPDLKVQTAMGEKLKLRADSVLVPDGHKVTLDVLGDRLDASIQSNDSKAIKNLLRKLARDNPEFDFENAICSSVSVDSYLDQALIMNFSYGGPAAGRSMVKSTLALLSEVHVDKAACERARAYLLDPSPEASPPYCFFFDTDLIVNRPDSHLFHCVSVIGQPQERRILGYVELFNFARILIHIGDGYTGKSFQKTYAVDPVAGKTLDLTVDFGRVKGSLKDLFQSPCEPPQMYLDSFGRTVTLVTALNQDRVRNMALLKANLEALKALGLPPSTEAIPPELQDDWIQLFMGGLAPYIEAQTKNKSTK